MPIIRAHDQFYTCSETARYCVEQVLALPCCRDPDIVFLEPSAGAGAFLELLPADSRLGLDIEPRHPEVLEQDFLAYELPDTLAHRPVVVVGNPPFGRNASLAVRFVNQAARIGDVIAFILPKTFQKTSTVRRLDPHLHLIAEYELPAFSFVFEGKPWDVPCTFQVWERRDELRVDEEGVFTHDDFTFVRRSEAQFAVRRVGRSAGIVIRDFANYSRMSHHFVRAHDPEAVIDVLNQVDWTAIRTRTAGVPCVGKEEIVRMYSAQKASTAAAVEATPHFHIED